MSLPDNFVHHLPSNFSTWQTHLVTHPQSIIWFSVGNHITQAILRLSVLYHPFGKTTINATKYLPRVIGTKCMHIKRCTASINQAYVSRYKELKEIKASKNVLLNDYSQKWSLPYHTYRMSLQKSLSQIFSVTPWVCIYQISLQHLIHHPSSQAVSHQLISIQWLLKRIQLFYWRQ